VEKRGSNKMTNRENLKRPPPAQDPEPPKPPPLQRKLQFHRVQLIGVPLLMVLPVLGLLGFFGETITTVSAANPQLSMQIEYSTRYRYKMINDMNVTITNLTEQAPVTVTVEFDRSYIDQFSTVTFTPSVERITGEVYEVELRELEAGGTQVIEVELQGEKYWHHTGSVSASLPDGEPVQIAVGTTIYP
jgi:hypothetical protein